MLHDTGEEESSHLSGFRMSKIRAKFGTSSPCFSLRKTPLSYAWIIWSDGWEPTYSWGYVKKLEKLVRSVICTFVYWVLDDAIFRSSKLMSSCISKSLTETQNHLCASLRNFERQQLKNCRKIHLYIPSLAARVCLRMFVYSFLFLFLN